MFENKLPTTAAFDVIEAHSGSRRVTIKIEQRRCQLSDNLSVLPQHLNAWRYIRDGSKDDLPGILPVALGPIFDVMRGVEVKVTWVNEIAGVPTTSPQPTTDGPVLQMPPDNPVDMYLNEPSWRTMNPSVGVVTHLHGGVVEAASDGWPLEPISFSGNPYGFPVHRHYTYNNNQRATMLWFHDHAMDNTSPQVHAGLAGVYFIRDDSDDAIFSLIGGRKREIPLIIQDRKYDCGFDRVNLWAGVPTSTDGPDPTDPNKMLMKFDRPEFMGDTVVVNGRPWPFVTLGRNVYRLRILNASNTRTYALALIDPAGWAMMGMMTDAQVWHSDLMTIIGNDGGLLPQRRQLAATDYVLLAPAERLDILLDLTVVDPMMTQRLRMVNLAVASAQAGDWPEGIYQTSDTQTFGANIANAPSSLIGPAPASVFDATLLTQLLSIGCANILEICLDAQTPPAPALDVPMLDATLAAKASEDGFAWDGVKLGLPLGQSVTVNRFVLMMNNTRGDGGDTPYAHGPWRDTQIWEMTEQQPAYNPTAFAVPFDIDLTNANPAPGVPGAAKNYYVDRWSFFADYPAAKRIDQQPYGYDQLNQKPYKPKAGTYERWYVADLGNDQPVSGASVDLNQAIPRTPTIPDMHPFHVHLVNFVVTGRWRYDAGAQAFTPIARPLNLDGVCRHDTVRVEANEIVELLLYFPPGYKGVYPFHCHLVEHEDMGMMSHFESA